MTLLCAKRRKRRTNLPFRPGYGRIGLGVPEVEEVHVFPKMNSSFFPLNPGTYIWLGIKTEFLFFPSPPVFLSISCLLESSREENTIFCRSVGFAHNLGTKCASANFRVPTHSPESRASFTATVQLCPPPALGTTPRRSSPAPKKSANIPPFSLFLVSLSWS